jgi:hypothetical protein
MTTPNLSEIGKIVREMQADADAKHKAANEFNQKGADIVKQGIEDKQRAKGWPVTPSAPVSEKQML